MYQQQVRRCIFLLRGYSESGADVDEMADTTWTLKRDLAEQR